MSAIAATATTGKALLVLDVHYNYLQGTMYARMKKLGLQLHVYNNPNGDGFFVWAERRPSKD